MIEEWVLIYSFCRPYQTRVWKGGWFCCVEVFSTHIFGAIDTDYLDIHTWFLWVWGRCRKTAKSFKATRATHFVIGAIPSAGTPGVHVPSVCFRLQLPGILIVRQLGLAHISIPPWLLPRLHRLEDQIRLMMHGRDRTSSLTGRGLYRTTYTHPPPPAQHHLFGKQLTSSGKFNVRKRSGYQISSRLFGPGGTGTGDLEIRMQGLSRNTCGLHRSRLVVLYSNWWPVFRNRDTPKGKPFWPPSQPSRRVQFHKVFLSPLSFLPPVSQRLRRAISFFVLIHINLCHSRDGARLEVLVPTCPKLEWSYHRVIIEWTCGQPSFDIKSTADGILIPHYSGVMWYW